MSYIVISDRVHTNPPQNGCTASVSSGKVVDNLPEWADKCDMCFDLPR